jgi:hypothetical protein
MFVLPYSSGRYGAGEHNRQLSLSAQGSAGVRARWFPRGKQAFDAPNPRKKSIWFTASKWTARIKIF